MNPLLISWYILSSLFIRLQLPIEANEMGKIPILEYHSIGPVEQRWTRSYSNFRGDLEWLYNNDYHLLSIEDYANNRYPVPAGKKPVILTFDDGKQNQFATLQDGSVDPLSAVGILDQFHEKHPDFGTAAVFYLNRNPFGPAAQAESKIRHLHETGRQIGFHTPDHNDLRRFSVEGAWDLLSGQKEALGALMPEGMYFTTLAYPHGWGPSGDRAKLAPLVIVGLLVGADPAYPLYHPKADPYRTPRIQAIDEEWLRHFGRRPGQTGKSEDSEKFEVFVSDGIPSYRAAD